MEAEKAPNPLERLTVKQRACLDLVLHRYTSKEIALRLGITPFAVDERLRGARRVLGADSREEAARRYAALLHDHEPTAYASLGVPLPPPADAGTGRDAGDMAAQPDGPMPAPAAPPSQRRHWASFGHLGVTGRLMAIVLVACGLMLAGVSALALMQAITLVARGLVGA